MCVQYKPSRWWFDFPLLYNKILFAVLSILMDSDAQAWNLLHTLTALTTATLVLIVVDKPFRDPDRVEFEGITLADKLMIVSQLAQLVNYLVAVVCLRSKESRLAEGSFGASEEVELFAAVVGFALVAVQAAGMIYAYRHERAKETSTGTEREEERTAAEGGKGETETEFENPVAAESPE
eukprot:COSAG06_NODE_2034_length_7781_cov_9.499089_5_plen_180_part_00